MPVLPPPQTVSALRSLLAVRFPEKTRGPSGGVSAAVRPIDDALGGGLPAGRLTELVSAVPSGGGQTVVAKLLSATQAARQRMALIDGADGFAPEAVPAGVLRHLVWVRCRAPEQAFAAADILVRDGNYAAVVLDLRGCAERILRRSPPAGPGRPRRGRPPGARGALPPGRPRGAVPPPPGAPGGRSRRVSRQSPPPRGPRGGGSRADAG